MYKLSSWASPLPSTLTVDQISLGAKTPPVHSPSISPSSFLFPLRTSLSTLSGWTLSSFSLSLPFLSSFSLVRLVVSVVSRLPLLLSGPASSFLVLASVRSPFLLFCFSSSLILFLVRQHLLRLGSSLVLVLVRPSFPSPVLPLLPPLSLRCFLFFVHVNNVVFCLRAFFHGSPSGDLK